MDLTSRGSTWLKLSTPQVLARGRVQPRLEAIFQARTPVREIQAQLIQLEADVVVAGERVGVGTAREIGRDFNFVETSVTVEVPMDSHALAFIEEHFREATLHLQFEWRGMLRVKHEQSSDGIVPSVPVGEWHFLPLDPGGNSGMVSISRSDWVHHVLAPVGVGDFVSLEIAVPKLPDPETWRVALDHLRTAEEQYHLGNDPGVFHHCYAVFERFRGDSETLFPTVPDESKRKKINDLLMKLNAFFQAGRHTSTSGSRAGQFAVDHRDAEAALAMTKIFLAYLARLAIA
jgi:hypothetical protein